MMGNFSQGLIKFLTVKGETTNFSDKYTEFFHSSLTLNEMENMDVSFMIIMFLLHFNPVNLILKYTIIKFKNFTEIIIKVKEEINDRTTEKP